MRDTPRCDILHADRSGPNDTPILAIVGPTASGKTAVGVEVAERVDGEIVSADSVAVYRGFDIGAAKPDAAQRARVRFHLLDVAEPDEDFSVARFRDLALAAIAEIRGRGKRPVVVGGTGLYVRVLLDGFGLTQTRADPELRRRLEADAEQAGAPSLHARLATMDPEAASRIHPNDRVRIVRALEVILRTGERISALQARDAATRQALPAARFGLRLPRDELDRRIERRVHAMMGAGLLGEVEGLLARGVRPDARPMSSLGYKELVAFVQGNVGLQEAIDQIVRNTRRFARRQMTWFRADSRILWIDAHGLSPEDAAVEVLERLAVTQNGA